MDKSVKVGSGLAFYAMFQYAFGAASRLGLSVKVRHSNQNYFGKNSFRGYLVKCQSSPLKETGIRLD